MNVPLYANQTSKFKERFAIRYLPYIESGHVSIWINSIECRPVQQDVVNGSETDVHIQLPFDRAIAGRLALLKKRSIRGNYGIHLFWNGRLIKAFSKFGFAAHPENARIIGRLDLNHVPVNYSKTGFLQESTEYKNAEHEFAASAELKTILSMSRSEPRQVPDIRSVFEYFAGNNKSGSWLDVRLRAKFMQDAMRDAEPFVVKMGQKDTRIDFSSKGPDAKLYTISNAGEMLEVLINRDSRAFAYVKNHLFLMCMIASDVATLARSDTMRARNMLEQKNHTLKEFLCDWSAGQKTPTASARRHGAIIHDDPPYIPNYGLDKRLAAAYGHLKENSEFAFQFTAMSTLTPYLYTARGKIVYTVYTVPHRSRYIADLLEEVSDNDMAISCKPDAKEIGVLLDMHKVGNVMAVRESSKKIRPTVAGPDKAFADLATEVYRHKIPLDELEINRVFSAMTRQNLVRPEEVGRHVRIRAVAKKLECMMKSSIQ